MTGERKKTEGEGMEMVSIKDAWESEMGTHLGYQAEYIRQSSRADDEDCVWV